MFLWRQLKTMAWLSADDILNAGCGGMLTLRQPESISKTSDYHITQQFVDVSLLRAEQINDQISMRGKCEDVPIHSKFWHLAMTKSEVVDILKVQMNQFRWQNLSRPIYSFYAVIEVEVFVEYSIAGI